MSELVVLSGNPRAGSRTSAFAVQLAGSLGHPDPEVIELADAVAINFDAEPVAPRKPRPDAVDVVTAARVLIVATPSYKGTFTGLLKVFLDRLAAGDLAGVTVVPVAVAGSPAHAEATAADLLRLVRELGADAPSAVAILESRLADADEVTARHARRLRNEFARV
jgi:FMN reductase